MKNLIKKTLIIIGAILLGPSLAFASVFIVPQGGTGKSTFTTGIVSASGTNSLFTSASTTVTCSGTVSCTGFVALGASPITITGSAASSPIATSTSETKGFLPYWTSTAGTPATLGSVATTSVTNGTGIGFTGTAGALVGGTNLTITNSGVISGSCPGGFLTCSGTNPLSFTLGTLGIGNGGTATTTWYDTGLSFYNSSLGTLSQASRSTTNQDLNWDRTNGRLGIGTTTPSAQLSVNPNGITGPAFAVGSSTGNLFSVGNGGTIALSEQKPATTTSMTLDWSATPSAVLYQIGASATTISIINATTSLQAGSRKLVTVCNPGAAAGALTWTGAEWFGGTAPTQTTTANVCDAWSFYVTQATSTSAYKVFGAQSANAQ